MEKKLQLKIFMRSLMFQTGWNFVGIQNIGFAFCIFPALKKIYSGENLSQSLFRHMTYFNTNPYMAGFTLGLCAKMEEQAVTKRDLYDKISYLKQTLSPVTAAIGDRFFWAALKPFSLFLTVFITVALGLNPAGLAVGKTEDIMIVLCALAAGFLFYNFAALYIRWKSIEYGYNCAHDKYCGVNFINWNKTIYRLKITGMIIFLSSVIIFTVRYIL